MLTALRENLSDGLKALRINYGALAGLSSFAPVYSGGRNYMAYVTPGSDVDYAGLVGDVWHNSAVRACIHAFMRARTEAPPVVQAKDGEDWNNVDHDLSEVLQNPNDQYSASVFYSGMELSWSAFGTAYAKIVRDNAGRPRELWYLPHKWVMPFRDGTSANLVDYYRYTPPAMPQEIIQPEDMLQWQFGVNPDAPWYGMGYWDATLREIATDHEAANYEASSLRNGGSGWLLSQDAPNVDLTTEQIERAIDILRAKTTRDKRGGYAWLDGMVKASQVGTNPNDMALELIRRIPETRIAADCGLPCGWIGLMAGVEHNTYSNSETDERKAWNTICCILCMQAEQTTRQLLHTGNYPQAGYGQYGRNSRSTLKGKPLRVWFDTSMVAALKPNKPEVWQTAIAAYEAGVISLDECRADMDLPLLRDLTPEQRAELTTRQQFKLNPPELIKANNTTPMNGKNGNANQKVLA